MSSFLRRLLLGRPLATAEVVHTHLPKRLALAVFSSDALSSTAYATEEILRVLLLVSAGGAMAPAVGLVWPIAIGIAALLWIVALSYRQTIGAFPQGASAYLVAKENLGQIPSLVAAASLLTDYILTVAVSVAAGIAALKSAVPALHDHSVAACLACVLFLTIANLRGARESGTLFAIPTYGFVGMMFLMIGLGLFQTIAGTTPPPSAQTWTIERALVVTPGGAALAPVTLFVLLRAFAAGCTALTGVEAISDGIPAFRPPQARNASTTLLWMVAILTTMFLGVSFLAQSLQTPALPESVAGYETVVSQIGRRVFSYLPALYYLLIAFSSAILLIAANTAFQDFPRLASLLGRDGFLPRQLADLGDRLVFQNGILALAGSAGLLLLVFQGHVASLLPLYAVGVFTSFTLSQASMVRHWLDERRGNWIPRLSMNAVGATATAVVLVVIGITKFNTGHPTGLRVGTYDLRYGAWIVVALVPLLVGLFRKIHGHYADVARFLQSQNFPRLTTEHPVHHIVLVLVPGLHQGIFPAIEYALSLSADTRAVHIETDPIRTPTIKEEWERHIEGVPLLILESPYRNLLDPLIDYIREVIEERREEQVTVVIPELIATRRWWHRLLHGSAAVRVRRALAQTPGVVVTSYRYIAEENAPLSREDADRAAAAAGDVQETKR